MFRSFAMQSVLDEVRTTGQSAYGANDLPTSLLIERVAAHHGVSSAKLYAELQAFDRAQDSADLADLADYLTAAVATAASCVVGGTQYECDHMMSLRADVERVMYLQSRFDATLNDL